MQYGIWCTVSGGVTGPRAAWLKENQVRKVFSCRIEAEQEAADLQSIMNSSPYTTTRFTYTVRQIEE